MREGRGRGLLENLQPLAVDRRAVFTNAREITPRSGQAVDEAGIDHRIDYTDNRNTVRGALRSRHAWPTEGYDYVDTHPDYLLH